jgi:hypothetical protein
VATQPAMLAAVRHKLQSQRDTQPMFHTDLFRRYIEAACLQMWDIFKRGTAPRSFTVSSDQCRDGARAIGPNNWPRGHLPSKAAAISNAPLSLASSSILLSVAAIRALTVLFRRATAFLA